MFYRSLGPLVNCVLLPVAPVLLFVWLVLGKRRRRRPVIVVWIFLWTLMALAGVTLLAIPFAHGELRLSCLALLRRALTPFPWLLNKPGYALALAVGLAALSILLTQLLDAPKGERRGATTPRRTVMASALLVLLGATAATTGGVVAEFASNRWSRELESRNRWVADGLLNENVEALIGNSVKMLLLEVADAGPSAASRILSMQVTAGDLKLIKLAAERAPAQWVQLKADDSIDLHVLTGAVPMASDAADGAAQGFGYSYIEPLLRPGSDTLTVETWERVLGAMTDGSGQSWRVEVRQAVAKRLSTDFARAFRAAFKLDWAADGEAAAAITLDMHRVLLQRVGSIASGLPNSAEVRQCLLDVQAESTALRSSVNALVFSVDGNHQQVLQRFLLVQRSLEDLSSRLAKVHGGVAMLEISGRQLNALTADLYARPNRLVATRELSEALATLDASSDGSLEGQLHQLEACIIRARINADAADIGRAERMIGSLQRDAAYSLLSPSDRGRLWGQIAHLRWLQRRFGEADDAFERAAAASGDAPRYERDRMLLRIATTRPDDAAGLAECVSALQRMVQNSTGSEFTVQDRLRLGHMLARDPGARRQARDVFEDVLACNPGSADALCGLARCDLEDGKADEAIARLEAVVQTAPSHAYARLLLGITLLRSDAADPDAERHLRAALRHNPFSVDARHNLALLLARDPGRRAEAITLALEAVDIDPLYSDSHATLADILGRTPHDHQAARRAYERAVQLNDANLRHRESFARWLLQQIRVADHIPRPRPSALALAHEAKRVCEDIRRRDPQYPGLLWLRGTIALELEQHGEDDPGKLLEEAAELLRLSLTEARGVSEATNLGVALRRLLERREPQGASLDERLASQLLEARGWFAHAVELDPDDRLSRMNLGALDTELAIAAAAGRLADTSPGDLAGSARAMLLPLVGDGEFGPDARADLAMLAAAEAEGLLPTSGGASQADRAWESIELLREGLRQSGQHPRLSAALATLLVSQTRHPQVRQLTLGMPEDMLLEAERVCRRAISAHPADLRPRLALMGVLSTKLGRESAQAPEAWRELVSTARLVVEDSHARAEQIAFGMRLLYSGLSIVLSSHPEHEAPVRDAVSVLEQAYRRLDAAGPEYRGTAAMLRFWGDAITVAVNSRSPERWHSSVTPMLGQARAVHAAVNGSHEDSLILAMLCGAVAHICVEIFGDAVLARGFLDVAREVCFKLPPPQFGSTLRHMEQLVRAGQIATEARLLSYQAHVLQPKPGDAVTSLLLLAREYQAIAPSISEQQFRDLHIAALAAALESALRLDLSDGDRQELWTVAESLVIGPAKTSNSVETLAAGVRLLRLDPERRFERLQLIERAGIVAAENPAALVVVAGQAALEGQTGEAVALYRRAYRQNAHNPTLALALAEALLIHHRTDGDARSVSSQLQGDTAQEATALCERAASLMVERVALGSATGESASLFIWRAVRLLRQAGDNPAADRLLVKAGSLRGAYSVVVHDAAVTLLLQGRESDARKLIRDAIADLRVDGDPPMDVLRMVWAAARTGKSSEDALGFIVHRMTTLGQRSTLRFGASVAVLQLATEPNQEVPGPIRSFGEYLQRSTFHDPLPPRAETLARRSAEARHAGESAIRRVVAELQRP